MPGAADATPEQQMAAAVAADRRIQTARLRAKIERLRPSPEPDGTLSDENVIRDDFCDEVLALLPLPFTMDDSYGHGQLDSG